MCLRFVHIVLLFFIFCIYLSFIFVFPTLFAPSTMDIQQNEQLRGSLLGYLVLRASRQ